jgi:hypothetical protein
MPHENRKQVRIPQRLWDEMMLALDQALGRMQAIDTDPVVTRQVYEFGVRVLREARRRSRDQ